MNTKTAGVSLVSLILFLFLIKLFDISYPLKVTVANTPQDLAVVGEGKVEAVPDTAHIDVGITINNVTTPEEAKGKVDNINNILISSLKKLGISTQEIKTANYSISPAYSYENNVSKIIGYNGNATTTIKTKKINLIPQIIEESAKAGANQINNTQFTVDNPEKYREAAREKAIQNAKDQAEKMARSLGLKLGKITNVVESLNGGATPLYNTAMYKGIPATGGGGDTTIEAGSETVTSTVTLYFENK